MSIRLTQRDLQLIQWVNSIGFVTIHHIAQYLKIAKPTAYARIHKLTSHGYLIHEHIFHGAAGIYRVTQTGVQVSGSELPPLRKVSLATYRHDLQVIDLSFKLLQRYGGEFIPERQLRHDKGIYGFGSATHMPDGALQLGDKQIAIECELTKKSKRRIEKIIGHYMKTFDYSEVWYFCGSEEAKRQIGAIANSVAFIEVFLN
jgi:hypothetical protein